ncbi:MAG: transglutaminase-like domain-containing protein [Firmicutes bacterium]|nr:transglutaminase-like domain-containing protein [Bacillota bacterium]
MFSIEVSVQITNAYEKRFKAVPFPKDVAAVTGKAPFHELICLMYLYAYMPVSDMVSYPPDLFVQVVRQARKVRNLRIFRQTIPDEIFLNFVLQLRVNNENLEYNRDFFFDELYPRIRGLSAREAVLEINYWCLEKVTYIGNSIRTMSPFTLMKNTKGRCGEESVFTVSALRSVGIPARQIYTPRWAHCESNHAWVEVYVDGGWHFIGACEPEPVLDKGWFTSPASKGIIIHARSFSGISTPGEEISFKTDSVCEINRTAHYVQHPVNLRVKVLNGNKDVKVHVQIVSNCAFASLIALSPDENGVASVTIGKGDVQIYVTDHANSITRHLDTRVESDIEIDFAEAKPCGDEQKNGESLLFTPPFSDYQDPDYGLRQWQIDTHEEKIAKCNELRNAYAATFADEEKGEELARHFGLDDFDAGKFFVAAKGNLNEIIKFMELSPASLEARYKCMTLRSLQAKDFTDCTAEILAEHLEYALPFRDNFCEEIFEKYILCPRVEIEMITPYRAYICDYFDAKRKAAFFKTPARIWKWINKNIKNTDEYRTGNDYRTLTASPAGLLKCKCGGDQSRKLLFVAICRTLGVPARINSLNGQPEYYSAGRFVKLEGRKGPAATVELTINGKNGTPLSYYENFTLARLENGQYNVLGLKYGNLEMPLKVERGHYQIVTGRRLENGTMSVKVWHVEINDKTKLEVEVPPEEKAALEAKPLGDYNFNGTSLSSLLTGKDLVACIRPGHEPTEHLLRELMEARDDYKRHGVRVALVALKNNDTLRKVKAAYDEDLTIVTAEDDDFAKFLAEKTGLNAANLPVAALVGEGGNALYYVQGYHVGSVGLVLTYL